MTRSPSLLLRALCLTALAAAMAAPLAAFADDYADVTQLMRSGKPAEAMARADQYLAAKPRDPQMRFLKAVLLSESGKPAEAIAAYTSITQEYPELPEPYNNLAVLYAAQSEFDKAREALETAVRANPSYATAHENLGDVYARLAGRSYVRAVQLAPANQSIPRKISLIREMFMPAAKPAP
ncbi:MAG: tetratricopeptide repeat protein [Pseudomonadota bacterium]